MDIYSVWLLNQLPSCKNKSLYNQGNITEMTGKGAMIHVWYLGSAIIEAMAAIVLADFYLINKIY
jgi:chorismate synthase